MIKSIFQWFVYSSADPTKISLTLKSVFAGFVTIATIYAGFSHVDVSAITSTDFSAVTDSVIHVIQGVAAVVSSAVFIFGFLRKIYYTLFPKY